MGKKKTTKKHLLPPWPLSAVISIEPRTEFCHSRHSVSVDELTQTRKVKPVNYQDKTGKLITRRVSQSLQRLDRAETCKGSP